MTLFELLQQSGIVQYDGIVYKKIEEYQQKLYNNGMANIPLSYARLLEKTNGIQTDALSLFGIGSPDSFIRDIFEVNSFGAKTQNEKIYLGDNLTEYFLYDWSIKSYVIIEKNNPQNIKTFFLLEDALSYFLREYLTINNSKKAML